MKQFESWKEAVGEVAYNFMLQRFSLCPSHDFGKTKGKSRAII
jgi:hypothetical protein